MDRDSLCTFCLNFWTGNHERWLPPMHGFDRPMIDMKESAATGCHCCAIFLANTDLLVPHAEKLGLDNTNRVFVTFNEDLLALCFLHSEQSRTPLRFVLKRAYDLEPKIQSLVRHESYTGSPTSFEQAREWLRTCQQSHPDCRSSNAGFRPTRLLLIDSDAQNVKLQHKESFPVGLQYATLSHCWGQTLIKCLKRDNVTVFEQGVSFEQLATTFRETIAVCQELQIKYIWIDCFCIFQDSPEDWKREALQMRHVYGNSFLNIAATDSKDSHGGLFRERNVKALRPFKLALIDLFQNSENQKDQEYVEKVKKELLEKPTNSEHIAYLTDIELCWDRFEQAPLNRRSWVVQERFLSPRVLHYDKDQLVWECHSLTACDRFPGLEGISGLVPDKKRIRLSIEKMQRLQQSGRPIGQEFHDIWRPMIKSYTSCGLTRQTDRLIALEGIAQRLAQLYGCSYVAGLFTRDMESQLTWRLARDFSVSTSRIPDIKIAPSWSWASFLGEIDMLPQWDSVDLDQKSRRLKDEELFETVLCRVTNKEQLAATWAPSVDPARLHLEISGFLVQARLVDFAEMKSWPKGKQQMRVWREDFKNGPMFSQYFLPLDEDRPLDDLWPLKSVGGGGGVSDYEVWEGKPNCALAVHSLTNIQEDSFLVRVDLDDFKSYRERRTLFLMPTYEVTKYEAQDIWEKINVRSIHGLILEKLEAEADGEQFRRIGIFGIDARERNKFWRAAVETEITGVKKQKTRVENWPDLHCEVSSGQSFVYQPMETAEQYQITVK